MTNITAERRIAVLGTGFRPTGNQTAPKEIAAIAGGGFLPELVEPRFGAFPRTPYDRGLAAIGNIDAGITAAANGFSAIFLNTFGDYGIVELRSALHIPVIGAGEAAMTLASTLGRRFAIVTVWPRSMNFIYDERLAACLMRERCAGIVNILGDLDIVATERGDPDDPVTAMRAGSGAIVDRIVAGAEAVLADGDVDTIILGCTCMAPIGNTVAANAIRTATTTVIRTGASRVLVIARPRGSRPSRAIANITRDSPSTSTMTTVVRPASAPMEMIFAAQSMPLIENAVARLALP